MTENWDGYDEIKEGCLRLLQVPPLADERNQHILKELFMSLRGQQ